jgi:hypothetical protein
MLNLQMQTGVISLVWRRLVALSEHPPMNVAMDTCQHLAPGETSLKNRTHYDTIQKLTEGGGFWS